METVCARARQSEGQKARLQTIDATILNATICFQQAIWCDEFLIWKVFSLQKIYRFFFASFSMSKVGVVSSEIIFHEQWPMAHKASPPKTAKMTFHWDSCDSPPSETTPFIELFLSLADISKCSANEWIEMHFVYFSRLMQQAPSSSTSSTLLLFDVNHRNWLAIIVQSEG